MKGKDHIFISLTWAFLIISPVIIAYPIYFISFLVGTLLGSVFPDIDSPHSPYDKKGDIMRGTGIASRSSSKLTISLFKLFGRDRYNQYGTHRGLMHSIPGIIVSTLIIIIPLNLIVYLLGYWNFALFVGSVGFFAGALFHLLEDCCTCSGVHLIYPFSNKKLRGGINTRDGNNTNLPDSRPKNFGKMFAVLGVAFIIYDVALRKMPMFSQFNYIEGLTFHELMGITTIIGFIGWIVMFVISQNPNMCNKRSR